MARGTTRWRRLDSLARIMPLVICFFISLGDVMMFVGGAVGGLGWEQPSWVVGSVAAEMGSVADGAAMVSTILSIITIR